jgi:hypothetical protein
MDKTYGTQRNARTIDLERAGTEILRRNGYDATGRKTGSINPGQESFEKSIQRGISGTVKGIVTR